MSDHILSSHDTAAVSDQEFQVDLSDESGAQTAEYGIVMLAAVGFAGLLAVILSGGAVQDLLNGLVEQALQF
ncbi:MULTISPECIES: DUF4244 domain-containing protein [Auritidibacter]|uniref:DUF4244 domain-containing protein n=1 Tax=Auritidibacter ignavus TaxID=678932 RepID=A0AAJ6DEV3_9MICC|nr:MULTISPECIES: DUF4244 domain-containing protein [Auritidibacter]PXA75411.1 DUF4244 domain-containing protein [Auritidibacter sp. NML120779]AXR74896.1 DUF4244 domain-containing protein [Auritidibacter sp. NML130574]NIH71317.1 Flp pilus assembly pilin Flp [Auritidibacter ignavus]RMX23506.1 DUF4244 domain-containing protein [Auritidibacter ignavus]WGH81445.1 DUF4244 domain-containing protein [Auritidibacter ignavus]